MDPRAWVSQISFSDGSIFDLNKDDIIVIVGPNNSGKSAALRGVREKFAQPTTANSVVIDVTIQREGSTDDLDQWLQTYTKRISQPNLDHSYQAFGTSVLRSRAVFLWQHYGMEELSRFFCHLLTADERLQAANPAGSIAISQEAPSHPIHFLQRDDALEERVSQQFRRAFGLDLIVHRNAGNQVPLHVGVRPKVNQGEDRVSLSYITELEKLPTIHTQGDGLRSFAGVLLHILVGRQTTLLVDEPEAFLHPPQALTFRLIQPS